MAAISSLWAIEPEVSIERTMKMSLVLIPGLVLFSQMIALDPCLFDKGKKLFIASVCGTGVLLSYDLMTRNGLFFATRETLPQHDNFSEMNRSVVTFLFFSIFAFYFIWQVQWQKKTKIAVGSVLAAILTITICKTDSQATQLALAMIVLFALFFPIKIRPAWAVLGIVIAALFVTAPWLAQAMFTLNPMEMEHKSWLGQAYAHERLEIWDAIARKILENPINGFGIESTRLIENLDTANKFMPLDHVLHPHNFVLQIWIEFGLVGVIPTIMLISAILYYTMQLSNAPKRLCLSVFMAFMIIASISYGLWQGWWIGLFVILASLCAFLIKPEVTGQNTSQSR